MTQTAWDCTDARTSLGVYVLGAIDPAERTLVDAHLATCQECRDELAGLAGIPALLSRVSADEVGRISVEDAERAIPEDNSQELLGSVISLTAARRRRNRWRNLALTAAAAVVIAAGTVVGLRVSSNGATAPSQAGVFHTESAVNSQTGVKANFSYAQEPWGTSIQTTVFHIPMGTWCVLWVTNAQGKHVWVGSWVTSSDEGRVAYPSSVSVPVAGIKGWDITQGVNGRQLISGTV
jgi:anti-sigma-K factor RskA